MFEDFGGRPAFFAKMFSRTAEGDAAEKHVSRLQGKVTRGPNKGKKRITVWRNRRKEWKKDNPDMVLSQKNKTRRKKGSKRKKKNESAVYYKTFNRRLDEDGPVIGAVRVWFNESDEPVSYEYYDRAGMLEHVIDDDGFILHETGEPDFHPCDGLWEDEDGDYCLPAMFEESGLPARHGGKTGVMTKGDEWKGKSGPEYSYSTMHKPGDRGQQGSALTPGDYDDASEEGDGEHIEKGTWPESFDVELAQENEVLRERIEFLEGELSRYEDIVQEQHEALREADERARLMQVEEARNVALQTHPELSVVADRLKLCESVEELNSEIDSMLSLVETVQPAPAPAPAPVRAPVLTERSYSSAGSSGLRDGVPSGMLMESSTPTVDGLRGNDIGSGDVASRVAAHRKRRLGK